MYADGDMSKMLQEVINGRADAHIASIKVTADYVLKEQGLDSELRVFFHLRPVMRQLHTCF